ncbi:MAG: DMT family transporter [Candidatus Saccharimonadales bacterium]
MWLLLTFLSILSRAVYGLMSKVLTEKVKLNPYTQTVLLCSIAFLLSLVLSPALGSLALPIHNINMVALMLVILTQATGNVLYFTSMQSLTSGTAQISFSSILVFNSLFAVLFLDLHLSLVNYLGILLLGLAVVSATTGKIELHRKSVLTMIIAAAFFAVFQLSSSVVSKQISAATYLCLAYGGTALLLFTFKTKLVYKELRETTALRKYVPIVLYTALPSLGNFVFAYYAYRTAPEPAKVALLLTTQVVIVVILSYIFLHERTFALRKFLAAIAVVFAAYLIKL